VVDMVEAEVDICEWLRGKFLINKCSLNVEELRYHLSHCERCQKLFSI